MHLIFNHLTFELWHLTLIFHDIWHLTLMPWHLTLICNDIWHLTFHDIWHLTLICLCHDILFTKKEKFARHLKKICKIFVKDLKCTLLIYIWNVLCVGANISKLLSVMLDPNPNPDPDPWSWYWWHWSNPTPLLLMDSEVILAIWKV